MNSSSSLCSNFDTPPIGWHPPLQLPPMDSALLPISSEVACTIVDRISDVAQNLLSPDGVKTAVNLASMSTITCCAGMSLNIARHYFHQGQYAKAAVHVGFSALGGFLAANHAMIAYEKITRCEPCPTTC